MYLVTKKIWGRDAWLCKDGTWSFSRKDAHIYSKQSVARSAAELVGGKVEEVTQ